MNTAEQIILIILAGALAFFLVLAIYLMIQLVRLVKVVNELAAKAQHLIDSAETAAETVKNAAGQVSILKFVHSVVEMVGKRKK
ncbi:MAG TPA: hypothetical protein VLE73_05700 [Candidatus Saccharimonadales bacterium]|nr:hypothetical protein [Candidatus Saccharimonadales bacterium]